MMLALYFFGSSYVCYLCAMDYGRKAFPVLARNSLVADNFLFCVYSYAFPVCFHATGRYRKVRSRLLTCATILFLFLLLVRVVQMKARLALSDETAEVLEELKLVRGSFTLQHLALALYQSVIIVTIL